MKLTKLVLAVGLVLTTPSCGSGDDDGSGGTSSGSDAAASDSGRSDSPIADSSATDGRVVDSVQEARGPDSTIVDTALDFGAADLATRDSPTTGDSTTVDSGAMDATDADIMAADSSLSDGSTADTSIADSASADSDGAETPTLDVAIADGMTSDSDAAETSTPDTGAPDAGDSGDAYVSSDAPLSDGSLADTTDAVARYSVTVSKAGNGTGTVTSSPPGIDCGSTCSADYDYGTVVSLFAPSSNSGAFMGWSGSCAGMGGCSVTMNSARFVGATFALPMTCSTSSTASSCTNATISEINLGPLASTTCHDQCQISLRQAGVTTGCWIVALNGNCYCRGGVLNGGGTRQGGSCN